MQLPPADHVYGLSAEDPRVAHLWEQVEMPPVENGSIKTINFGGGAMLLDLDPVSERFIDFSASCCLPVLDIGCAYGIATLPALERTSSAVIANDICPEHLVLIAKQAAPEARSRLFLAAKKFPEEVDFPENSLGAVLMSRVLHFLRGEDIEKGFEKIAKWLAPGGKLFIITATPYQKPIQDLISLYEERWEQGDPWPGYIPDYAQRNGYDNLFPFLNVMDERPLKKSLEKAKLVMESTEFVDRQNTVPRIALDGREGIGVVAIKPFLKPQKANSPHRIQAKAWQ